MRSWVASRGVEEDLATLYPFPGASGYELEQPVVAAQQMGSALARNREEDDGEVIRHLTQRVAIVLVRPLL